MVTAELEWVNHASFIVRHGRVALLTDPWLSGAVFNDGWELVVPSVHQPSTLGKVSHIWLSHEHPDHFNPPTLRAIPEDIRCRVTVLFQETHDRRVVNFCRSIGFVVRELPQHRWLSLDAGFRVMLGRFLPYDSWLLLEVDGQRVLNLNDCVVDRPRALGKLARRVGPIDVLMTQFSYANWLGNPDEGERRQDAATNKLKLMGAEIDALRPKQCIPFASFCWFAHTDNAYLNDQRNHVSDAAKVIEQHGSSAVVLAPGDIWRVGSDHDSQSAIDRYDQAFDVRYRPLLTSETKSLTELHAVALDYQRRTREVNNRAILWLLRQPPLRIGSRITVHLWDLGKTVAFDLQRGLCVIPLPEAEADVSMHSQSLWFVLKFNFGVDTLSVNGRFRGRLTAHNHLVRSFGIAILNNAGHRLSFLHLVSPKMIAWGVRRFALGGS